MHNSRFQQRVPASHALKMVRRPTDSVQTNAPLMNGERDPEAKT